MPPNGRKSWILKIWYQSSMNVFAKEFILPLGVIVIGLLIFTNPMNFDWTQRLTGAACIFFGAYFVSHTLEKANRAGSITPATASVLAIENPPANAVKKSGQSAPAQIASPSRVFLPPDISVQYLTGLYKDNTSLQADSLARNYIGKWMKQSAVVANVAEYPTFGKSLEFQILASLEHPPHRYIIQTLRFAETWKDRISVLKRGSEITFIGKISQIDSSSITFQDCEPVD
jgi:hypothetical protein